ncbi:Reverse transcriptase (RNA-dependent DNA polymerase) [Pseudovibrio sp. Ad5]|uniref:reverse transcriptase family protein n=1 Tax=Pseudovibrio sp. Ad5 TaxID=989436 RepID=UPI0007AE6857|nr:reverse transcriptase family protein [Pseudovibrio sp. Ad5]KZK93368.1 Reverse transcriptase (RNA-dependent DNA polymerase) [Pseudovibrio sp. Ad5]
MKHPWDSQNFVRGARASGRDLDTISAAVSIAKAIKQVSPNLPVIFSLSHLAHLVDVSPKDLRPIVDRMSDPYRHFRLRKKSGGNGSKAPKRRFRDIYAPQPHILRTQRWIAQNILNLIQPHPSSFGFAPGSDMLAAATLHCGCAWLLKMDVSNFFESITERQAYQVFRECGYTALLSFQLARLCTRSIDKKHYSHLRETEFPHPSATEGFLPQGAPTSPMLANLAVYSLDVKLKQIADELGWKYSRYADDIAFSTEQSVSRTDALKLRGIVEGTLKSFGLSENSNKTRISPPGARKILLGVLVDRERPRLTRRYKDNIETHLYALNHEKIGVLAHQANRKFSSVTGMRHHVLGLISFAYHVDRKYGNKLYSEYNRVKW